MTTSGMTIRLAAQTWWVVMAGRKWGVAFCYRQPCWVEDGSARRRIHDHTAWAQLIVLTIFLVTALIRRSAR
jgi:hypothetical protein